MPKIKAFEGLLTRFETILHPNLPYLHTRRDLILIRISLPTLTRYEWTQNFSDEFTQLEVFPSISVDCI